MKIGLLEKTVTLFNTCFKIGATCSLVSVNKVGAVYEN